MEKQKTQQEWDQIKFQNNLGPQIGGLLHDSIALVSAGIKPTEANLRDIKNWLNLLYDLAEEKKEQLTKIQPMTTEDSQRANDQFERKMKDDKIDAINSDINWEVDKTNQ